MEATATTGELLRELALPIAVGSEWRMEISSAFASLPSFTSKGGIDLQELLKVRLSQGDPRQDHHDLNFALQNVSGDD
jgi:hypothetical protein